MAGELWGRKRGWIKEREESEGSLIPECHSDPHLHTGSY